MSLATGLCVIILSVPFLRPMLLFFLHSLGFHAGEGEDGVLAKEDMGRFAGELLMPLMKSIYSNADKYVDDDSICKWFWVVLR